MRLLLACVALALALSACGGSPEGAAAPSGPTPTRAAAALLTPTPGIAPIRFPDDEAPHDVLTEWWYYTGHLVTEGGQRFGFEYVFFQANRGGFPTVYASHFAVTDRENRSFTYDQKIGPGPTPLPGGRFALALGDWTMGGANGVDRLAAAMDGYAIDLVASATKPPALHNTIGYLTYGDLGGSYYYSRTRMSVTGTVTTSTGARAVSGEAWMDHQWGNFIPIGGGGWDWFSVQLEDGSDLMAYLIRDATGTTSVAYGTLVDKTGAVTELEAGEFSISATGSWTSPRSGATYPMGWTIAVPSQDLSLTLTPTIEDQELDTRASTGVIYWEGEIEASGDHNGTQVAGLGYVELTGYASR